MNTPYEGPVVVGYDGSESSRRAVDWAVAVAEAEVRECDLLVVSAMEPLIVPAPHGFPALKVDQEQRAVSTEQDLARVVATCRQSAGALTVNGRYVQENPAQALFDVASEAGSRLLVIGPSCRGAIPRVILGSTAAELARVVDRPMIVVHGAGPPNSRAPVVVSTDGAATGDRDMDFAFRYADLHRIPPLAVQATANGTDLEPWRSQYP